MFADLLFNIPVEARYTYLIPDEMVCQVGCRVIAPLGRRKVTGYVVAVHDREPTDFTVRPIERVLDEIPLFSSRHIELAAWMASLYLCSQGEALSLMIPSGRKEMTLPSFDASDPVSSAPRELSSHQKRALEAILTEEHDLFYLFGVTGSGKTEVFLSAAQEVIAQGSGVIYLVPEISLTHQLSQAVSARFGHRAALLHSGLSASQRLKEWKRIASGEVDLVIGARSAIFAPLERIGLIIIDEEHENSYKSGTTPRYHARQIAFQRAQTDQAKVLMGSATPSLEAWSLMGSQRIRRLDLPERVSGGSMPRMSVVDMTGSSRIISRELQQRITEVLSRKRQVILFLNRRGFSYFFHCRSCSYEMSCPHCSVAMTYHKHKDLMVCHYCGAQARPVRVCPECGSLDVGYSGFGTEMVEQTVKQLFPNASCARVDADMVKKKEYLRDTLEAFRKGEIDILLGTQMVAKGLNFPGVELVGIVLADSALHLPDFRAQERTFGLLVQVAGRAGRFSSEGQVVIQTFHPSNPAVLYAERGDLEAFYEQELEVRTQLGFPPIYRMCRLVFRSPSQKRVEECADAAGELLEQIIEQSNTEGVSILGPAAPPIERIARNYRFQLILKGRQLKGLHAVLTRFRYTFEIPYGIYMEIDIDPISLL